MDRKQLLDYAMLLLENKIIDNNVYQLILNGINKIKLENEKTIDALEAGKQLEKVVANVIGIGTGQKINNLNISKEQKQFAHKVINNRNIQAHDGNAKEGKIDKDEFLELLEAIKQQTKNIPKVIKKVDKNKLLSGLQKKINGIIISSDIPKYFKLSWKVLFNKNESMINMNFIEKENRDTQIISKFSNYNIEQLKNEYDKLTKQRIKNYGNDFEHDITTQLIEILRLLSNKDIKNKNEWINKKKELEKTYKNAKGVNSVNSKKGKTNYSIMSVKQLNFEYSKLLNVWLKIDENDEKQKIKYKGLKNTLLEICQLLISKDNDNKQDWIERKKELENEGEINFYKLILLDL